MKAHIFTNNDQSRYINISQKSDIIYSKQSYPYKPIFFEILFILFRFLGFLFCLNVFSVGALLPIGLLISTFSLAWIIGLVIPAAPGGLGVFESVILFNLGSQLPEAALLASLLCYRLVSTISDMLACLIYPIKKLFDSN
tara:strand:- start:84 stop:503 length:420 start_codon:yes stop_codon:yes gene_type:complete